MPKQNNKFDKDSLNDMLPEDFTTQTKSNEQTAHSKQSTVAEDSVQKKSEHDSTQEDHSTDAPIESLKRPRGKQLKTSLEEYRQQFLQVPRIADRKPVFVSSSTRDLLDCIV